MNMADSDSVVVQVTDKKYTILVHPSGARFDADGKSMWPRDQFTTRVLADGAIKIIEPAAPVAAPASSK
jgi:hypothetical protein